MQKRKKKKNGNRLREERDGTVKYPFEAKARKHHAKAKISPSPKVRRFNKISTLKIDAALARSLYARLGWASESTSIKSQLGSFFIFFSNGHKMFGIRKKKTSIAKKI